MTTQISAALLRVYFLGSGAIAVPALRALLGSKAIELVGCGTQPDQRQGRRRQTAPTPVGSFCASQDIPVDKPESANSKEFLRRLSGLKPDMILVFAFGQILKKQLLELPPLGCINVHASLLPKYRGASPVNATILAGDSRTGLSIMQMEQGLDTGPVYRQFDLKLKGTETALDLTDQLAELAADNVCDTLVAIGQKHLTATAQDSSAASYAGKISKKDGAIDWCQSADSIERMVRGYFPWPTAYFILNHNGKKRKITITKATVNMTGDSAYEPGEIIQADKHGWRVACGNGNLNIVSVVPAGKKEMSGIDFLRGCALPTGKILTHETDDCKL